MNNIFELGLMVVLGVILLQNWLSTPGFLRFALNGVLGCIGLCALGVVFFAESNKSVSGAVSSSSTISSTAQPIAPADFGARLGLALRVLGGQNLSSSSSSEIVLSSSSSSSNKSK